MPSFNRVILVGNLTARPELRFAKSGNAWCRFGMAVNDRYKSAQGETTERVSFIDVTCFGRQAETLAQYLDKGSPLLVEGRLAQDKWEDDEGKKHSKLQVILRRFQFVDGGKRRGDAEDLSADDQEARAA